MSENTGAHLPRMMRNAYSLTEVKSVVDQSILLMVHVSGSLHTAILHFPFTLCMCDVFLHLSCLPPTFPSLKLHLKHFFRSFHTCQIHFPLVLLFKYAKTLVSGVTTHVSRSYNF